MRLRRRLIPGLAALLILLGSICPAVCIAASEDRAPERYAASASSTATSPCHGSSTPPENNPPGSGDPQDDCIHCEEPAISATTVQGIESPEPAITSTRIQRVSRALHEVADATTTSHDPPPRNLLLVKNSFLL